MHPASGARVQSVTIESDGEMRLFDGVEPPKVNNREDFLRAVRASGLVGMGGAGFPTHAKLRVMPDKHIDTLVINAAECEPISQSITGNASTTPGILCPASSPSRRFLVSTMW